MSGIVVTNPDSQFVTDNLFEYVREYANTLSSQYVRIDNKTGTESVLLLKENCALSTYSQSPAIYWPPQYYLCRDTGVKVLDNSEVRANNHELLFRTFVGSVIPDKEDRYKTFITNDVNTYELNKLKPKKITLRSPIYLMLPDTTQKNIPTWITKYQEIYDVMTDRTFGSQLCHSMVCDISAVTLNDYYVCCLEKLQSKYSITCRNKAWVKSNNDSSFIDRAANSKYGSDEKQGKKKVFSKDFKQIPVSLKPVETLDEFVEYVSIQVDAVITKDAIKPSESEIRHYCEQIAPTNWKEFFKNKQYVIIRELKNKQVIAAGEIFFGENSAGIYSIATREKYRRQGYATDIVVYFIEMCIEKGYKLCTLTSPKHASNLFYDLGFDHLFDTQVITLREEERKKMSWKPIIMALLFAVLAIVAFYYQKLILGAAEKVFQK